MTQDIGTAGTAAGEASRLQALVYTSPTYEFDGARGIFSPTTSTLIVGLGTTRFLAAFRSALAVDHFTTAATELLKSTAVMVLLTLLTHPF